MNVGLLTEYQKEQINNQELHNGWYFNPVQDANDNWVISTEEMESNENLNFMWVKDLPLIEWVEPIIDTDIFNLN
jgi:hypothetical protein